jgi:alpha-tubulin suppressor-like RCC1 family protein
MSPMGGSSLVANIGVGRAHGCGIPRFNGAAIPAGASQLVYCWGLNNAGQVGDGTIVNKLVPTAVTAPFAAVRFDSATLAVGASHACALEGVGSVTPGKAYCWGNNGSGQLGNVLAVGQSSVPVPVDPPAGGASLVFTRIYAGEHHTCGVTATGAYCWGRNDYGQLGIGSASATPSLVPVAVAGGLLFRSLSVGELFTCGVVGAATIPGQVSQSAGTAYCWGDNSFGQLGTNAAATVSTPTRVAFQP